MSDNTQEQGRSYYTERDFAFTPEVGANAAKVNLAWERGLLAATRVGDVTFDAKAKAAAINPATPPDEGGE